MAKSAYILQNEAHEGPELIADFLRASDYQILVNHLYQEPFAPPPKPDLVVMMGGSMSANRPTDEQAKAQKWLKGQVESSKNKLLGICLGAQTLAKLLGAEVHKGSKGQEIGYWEVESSPFAQATYGWPERFQPLHWHGDTYALPKGAKALGSSEAYAQQGFLWGKRVLGLQFHLEADFQLVKAFVEKAYPTPRDQDRYHQDKENLLRLGKAQEEANRDILFQTLERFLAV